jgi:poly-gamma-glutamate synthesis protein (capsule biosynthesis protein)
LAAIALGIFFNSIKERPDVAISSGRSGISSIVIPHHDIVREARKALLVEISEEGVSPETILLVSPNHFNAGKGAIQMSGQVWETVHGSISPNRDILGILSKAGVPENNESFTGEHGITALLAEIKEFFPEADIVPLMLKRGIGKETLQSLNKVLLSQCDNCLMIASVDFSHEQPALLAELHDVLSIRALQNQDVDVLLNDVEVDSPETLALMALWADEKETRKFSLFEHTNGGFIIDDADEPITTHVFGWYEKGESVTPESSATFLMTGDVMFARGIEKIYGGDFGEVFSGIGNRFFWGTDASIVNLEGAISTRDVPIYNDQENGYTFVFAPVVAEVLREAGVTHISLANNHSNNAGVGGYLDTRRFLEDQGLHWFGGYASEHISSIGYFSGEDIDVAIIGVHALVSIPDITSQIRLLKGQGKRVIVFPHWGTEYARIHNTDQEEMAHDWIDAGADLVVGAHPHVVQDVGVYKGRPIVYSLGNFLFDQNISKETQQGVALAGMFKQDGLLLFGLPTGSHRFAPNLLRGEEKDARLDELYEGWEAYATTTPVDGMYFFPY